MGHWILVCREWTEIDDENESKILKFLIFISAERKVFNAQRWIDSVHCEEANVSSVIAYWIRRKTIVHRQCKHKIRWHFSICVSERFGSENQRNVSVQWFGQPQSIQWWFNTLLCAECTGEMLWIACEYDAVILCGQSQDFHVLGETVCRGQIVSTATHLATKQHQINANE